MIWEKVKLGEVCTIEKGNIGIMKAVPGEYPLVVLGEERKTHNEFQFDDEAVIIPLVSSTGHGHRSMKRIFYQTGKFSIGSILCAVIPKDKTQLSAEFLYRYLDFNKENELVTRMRGMANVSLPIKEIADVEIPLPPLEIQKELIEEFQKIESGKNQISTELNHQLALVKELRQAYLREAMQGKLVPQDSDDEPAEILLENIKAKKEKLAAEKRIKRDKPLPPIKSEEIPFEIPSNWTWCRLKDIGFFTGGGTPSMSNSNYWDGDISWISPKDMRSDYVSESEMKITKAGVDNSAAKMIPANSLLIVGRSGILKRKLPVAINTTECTVNQDMKVIVPFLTEMSRYLQLMLFGLQEIILKDYVKFGMTVHSLKYQEFEEMPIPLPPLAEQERIVAKLEKLMKFCDELEANIRQGIKNADQLLQTALKEALEPK